MELGKSLAGVRDLTVSALRVLGHIVLGRLFLAGLVLMLVPASAIAADRIALVLGNAAYQHQPALKNPLHDIEEVERVLKAADFTVVRGSNLDKLGMERLVRQFLGMLQPNSVSLFYYSGHAIQVAGQNYLLPVEAKLASTYDLDFEAVSMDTLQSHMRGRSALQLLFLDACRSNPFLGRDLQGAGQRVRGSVGQGLASIRVGVGTLVSFATEPGNVAFDGDTRLSPFTQSFVKHALTPAIDVRQMLTQVRREVMTQTGGKQVPWENSSLVDDFYFVPPRPGPIVERTQKIAVPRDANRFELAMAVPVQPEGGKMRVRFSQLPAGGSLHLGDKEISADITLPAEELARVTFSAGPGINEELNIVGYEVADEWGNTTQAFAVLTFDAGAEDSADYALASGTNAQEDVDRVLHEQLAAQFAHSSDKPLTMPIGVGPVRLALNAPQATRSAGSQSAFIRVNKAPASGELHLGARKLTTGEAIAVNELGQLSYSPAVGSEGQTQLAEFSLVGANARSRPLGRLAMRPVVHDCDLLAAQPLDLQGVTTGVLASDIKGPEAIAACSEAVVAHPEVARFYYQLGRAQLAQRAADKALQLLQLAENKGHIRAAYGIGTLYAFGALGAVDLVKAVEKFRGGADKGDPFAMYSYGRRLYRGWGVDVDRKRGLTLMLQAAEMGHTFAMNELGGIFNRGEHVREDPHLALKYWTASAARQDIYGYDNLGQLYLDGRAVKRDYKKALTLFVKASEGGHPGSPNNIGRMYFNGWGVEKDAAKAAFWYEVAADRGDVWGAVNRAWLALNGPENLRNDAEAAKYYALGAILERGEPSQLARKAIGELKPGAVVQGLSLLAEEIGVSKPDARGRFATESKRQLAEKLAAYDLTMPATAQDMLLTLATLRWLSTKPRFDLL